MVVCSAVTTVALRASMKAGCWAARMVDGWGGCLDVLMVVRMAMNLAVNWVVWWVASKVD
jgi:hypothetical protein